MTPILFRWGHNCVIHTELHCVPMMSAILTRFFTLASFLCVRICVYTPPLLVCVCMGGHSLHLCMPLHSCLCSMLEVWLASAGAAIAGAAKGYGSSFHTRKPTQLYVGMSLLSLVALNEANRFRKRRQVTRAHIPGASAHLMDDTIIESSPTYLVDNFPLFVGIFAAAYTVVGASACILRSGAIRTRITALTVKQLL